MTRDDTSDPPSQGSDLAALSGLFPRAPTLDALFDSSRKQASQLAAILEANRQAVRRDRENAKALGKLEERVNSELREVKDALRRVDESIDGINTALWEYKQQQTAALVPEAEKKGKSDLKLALLMAGAALIASGLVGLLFHFLGKVSGP